MKLKQRPLLSSLGVKFKLFDEYPLPFHMGANPGFANIRRELKEWTRDGVKYFHHYNLENNNIFQVKKYKSGVTYCT